ncbi:hypothetical protein ACLI5Y_12360 [Enterococcus innesii]|uniref:hypothetical protein n=1 Tax=Enterococcus innesii TaxID=2839759 RepID=UPI0022B9B916|nr:hypothetical protein [Enterococcus innesii]
MLTLKLIDHEGDTIKEHIHSEEVYLAFKDRTYQAGEKIMLTTTKAPLFVWLQVDEALAPSLVYLKESEWIFPIITDDTLRRAYSPKLFSGKRHYLHAWLAKEYEINAYRNLAVNAHDQKNHSGAYPHAHANVETRNDSTFFARNAIDGMIANENHGSFPYQSWGINQQADAQLTIDFGRIVEIDKIALVLRGDYPHDSYWTQATLEFSNGQQEILRPTNQLDRQYFSFTKIRTSSILLKELIKHHDESPFPALTQIEIYGIECHQEESK